MSLATEAAGAYHYAWMSCIMKVPDDLSTKAAVASHLDDACTW